MELYNACTVEFCCLFWNKVLALVGLALCNSNWRQNLWQSSWLSLLNSEIIDIWRQVNLYMKFLDLVSFNQLVWFCLFFLLVGNKPKEPSLFKYFTTELNPQFHTQRIFKVYVSIGISFSSKGKVFHCMVTSHLVNPFISSTSGLLLLWIFMNRFLWIIHF